MPRTDLLGKKIAGAANGDRRLADRRIAKHLRLQWHLEEQIRTGSYGRGDRLPTHKELMEMYGCSCSTVTRALKGLVDGGLITRRRRAGTFVNDVSRAAPRPPADDPASTTVGMFHPGMPTDFHPYYSALVEGFMHGAQAHGFSLKLITFGKEGLRVADDLLRRNGICGFVCSAARASDVADAVERRLPVVFLYSAYPDIPVERVLSDPDEGALLAFGHLRGLGHRRVAVFSLRSQTGFHDVAARAYDCMPAEAPVDVIEVEGLGQEGIAAAVDAWRSLSPRPRAAFATDDVMLKRLWRELEGRGVRVPEDLAIVGWGSPLSAGFIGAPLTFVETDPVVIGRRAVDRVIAQLEGKGERGRTERVPPRLVVRESCGASRARR